MPSTVLKVVWVAALLLALAACAQPAHPAATVAATPPPDVVFVVPLGTAAAELRGEDLLQIPSPIKLVAGQRVVFKNEDVAMHYFFQQPVAPGQTLERTFDRPGTYTWSGVLSCSIGKASSLRVQVSPAGGAS
jgi:plastocyanin